MNENDKRKQAKLDKQLADARNLSAAFGVHNNNISAGAHILTALVIGKKGMSALSALQAESESFVWPTFKSLDELFNGLSGRGLLQAQKATIRKILNKYLQLRTDFYTLHMAEILPGERDRFETFSQQVSEMIDQFTFWLIAHVVDAGTTIEKNRKTMWLELLES